MREIIIGVDGGGTKTKFAALDVASGRIIADSIAKGINIGSYSMEEAVKNIVTGIKLLGLSDEDHIMALSIGDPALDDSVCCPKLLQKQLENSGLFAKDTRIFSCSDVLMALYGFSCGKAAALIVSGTGSMGVAFKTPYIHGADNDILTVGGWGGLTPDNGSGYSIALNAITTAMDAFDGIISPTALSREVQEFFHAESPRDLIRILDSSMKRADIAAFAVRVDACALNGDHAASEIIQSAGNILGRYALSLLRGMDTTDRKIGIYGSVLLNSTGVRREFERVIHEEFPEASILVPENPPEVGAIWYALDALSIHDVNF